MAAEEYCVAGIDSDRIFVTSLGDYKDDSYMFNRHRFIKDQISGLKFYTLNIYHINLI